MNQPRCLIDQIFEESRHFLSEKIWSKLRAKNPLIEAESSSEDENPVKIQKKLKRFFSFIIQCSTCICIHTINYTSVFLFTLSSFIAKDFSGLDADDWSVFELIYLASNTILKKSFTSRMTNGLRKIVLNFSFSLSVEPICFITQIFADHPIKHSVFPILKMNFIRSLCLQFSIRF